HTHSMKSNSQYHRAVADGSCDCRLPIFDFRLALPRRPIKNRQSKIGNVLTHPLPRDGTNCLIAGAVRWTTSTEETLMKRSRGNHLDRRTFIKASGAGLAGLSLLPKLKPSLGAQPSGTSQRRIFPLNHKWLYSDKALANGTSQTFDDRKLVQVTIPHT